MVFINLFTRPGLFSVTRIHIVKSLLFLALLVWTGASPAQAIGGEASHKFPGKTPSAISEPLSALKFYVVVDGKLENRIMTRREFSSKSFETDGYVSGIVAVGPRGVEARVDGRSMNPVELKADGTVSLGYYGKMKPSQLLNSGVETGAERNANVIRNCPAAEVYSFFPAVPADTVCAKERFEVEFISGGEVLRMQVSHKGALMLENASLPFRSIGAEKTRPAASSEDLKDRMDAVTRGVTAVESAFNMDLVSRVNIVGFEEIRNAVTCAGENEVWFYISTFKNEPVSELNVIAEHETLHILVDRLDLTRDRAVRNLFADLKGFDTFSIDRFRLVTQGYISPGARRNTGEKGYFFDFISERNFLNGMKGGHPQEDLDEFCTSFLHTLMYMDIFENHLGRPISGESPDVPEIAGKTAILENYLLLLGAVRDAFDRVPSVSASGVASARGIISERLERVEAMNRQLAERQINNERP